MVNALRKQKMIQWKKNIGNISLFINRLSITNVHNAP